jgi:hypothetical protein
MGGNCSWPFSPGYQPVSLSFIRSSLSENLLLENSILYALAICGNLPAYSNCCCLLPLPRSERSGTTGTPITSIMSWIRLPFLTFSICFDSANHHRGTIRHLPLRLEVALLEVNLLAFFSCTGTGSHIPTYSYTFSSDQDLDPMHTFWPSKSCSALTSFEEIRTLIFSWQNNKKSSISFLPKSQVVKHGQHSQN